LKFEFLWRKSVVCNKISVKSASEYSFKQVLFAGTGSSSELKFNKQLPSAAKAAVCISKHDVRSDENFIKGILD
jgi:hypothetical protein